MSEELHTCTICSGLFSIETEGGCHGFIGILPVAFCPTCRAGILDFADLSIADAFRSGYIEGIEMFSEHLPPDDHRDAEIATAFESYEEEQRT